MNSKDVSNLWLSSGGAYLIIWVSWVVIAIFFASVARNIGRQKNSNNDGCLLTISTTVFVLIGGAIGLLLFNKFFPWFIFTSILGAILAPWLVIRTFKRGKQKY